MRERDAFAFPPGTSVLGGAAAGLSYEGALRDVLAREDADRRRVPPQQSQATNGRREPDRTRAVLEPAR